MMKKHVNWWRISAIFICAVFILGGMCVLVDQGIAKQSQKKCGTLKGLCAVRQKLPRMS